MGKYMQITSINLISPFKRSIELDNKEFYIILRFDDCRSYLLIQKKVFDWTYLFIIFSLD